MIDRIQIKNFRAIHDLTLSGLGRVNVIVGNNASGKTALLSSGINKLFVVLSSIILRGKGVVLFDEIENGFYYERLESVWRAVFRLARKYDTQVFASTHSKECLKALAKVGKEYEGDLRLLRTEREHDMIAVSLLNGEIFEDAIEQGFEVR